MSAEMRALTVCQPYAELIARGEKRVENRSWATDYRGLLAIHAGKGTDYMEDEDWQKYPDLAWGAVVAVAYLVNCVRYVARGAWSHRYPWMLTHQHAEGPICWVLEDVRRLRQPVSCDGQRGLWSVPTALRAAIEAQLEEACRGT